jgi:predicted P-loop ATPase
MAWLAGVFYRYNNPENQNTMNLWEGAQGIGKDTFFKHLTRGFGLYARELSPDSRLNDLYGDIGSLLIAAMPEFDQFTGISAGALKDLITSPGKSFRSPYERKSQYHQFRCSFYSNANLSDYLRDTTGNRRFWVFEVDSIDHSYPKYTEECSQIVAQIYSLYQDRYQAKSENIKTVSDFVEANRTPEDPGKNIIELWEQRASEFLRGRSSNKMRYSDAVEIVNDMSRLTKANNRFILRILKINGFSREEGHENITYYYSKRSEKIYLPE